MSFTAIVIIAGFWVGLAKGGIGGPVAGAVLLTLLSQLMSVSEAVGVILPLLMFADVFALRWYWRDWDLDFIKLMLPASLVGIAIGTLMLTNLSDDILRRALGVLTLLIILYKVASDSLRRIAYSPQPWHGYLAGFSSGFMSSLANAGGPPITAYLLLQKMKPTAFVGTIALFFAVVNWLKVPGFLAGGILELDRLLEIIWIFPVIPFGVWIGRKTVDWINPKAFDLVMTVLLFFAALLLLFGSSAANDEKDEVYGAPPQSISRIAVTVVDSGFGS